MKAKILPFMALALCTLSAPAEAKQPAVDWIFVIDTSGSMSGQGGTPDIFDQVQRAIKRFVDLANKGDSVTLIPFAQTVEGLAGRYIGGQSDKSALFREIDALRAEGLYTHTGEAVHEALGRQKELSDPDREVCVIVLTDGIEDTRDKPNALHLQDVHIPPPDRRPYTIFVWLGSSEEEFQRSSLHAFKERLGESNSRVLLHPEARDIEALATEVRDLMNPVLIVSPVELDWGNVDLGAQPDAQALSIRSSRPTRVRVALSGVEQVPIELVEPNEDFELGEVAEKYNLNLRLGEKVPAGVYNGSLLIYQYRAFESVANKPALAAVPFRLVIVAPSISERVVRALAYLAGVCTVFMIGFCVYYQESPKELYRRFVRRKNLFGFLEPRSGGSSELIDLSGFQSGASSLAVAGVHLPGSSDAKFVAAKKAGRKIVVLQGVRGAVHVNGRPLERDAVLELYNLDEISIDDKKFVYHGPERP